MHWQVYAPVPGGVAFGLATTSGCMRPGPITDDPDRVRCRLCRSLPSYLRARSDAQEASVTPLHPTPPDDRGVGPVYRTPCASRHDAPYCLYERDMPHQPEPDDERDDHYTPR